MPQRILPIRKPFIFPGGNPGVDFTHIAAKGILRFSAVPIGNTFINILRGQKPTAISGTSVANYGVLGKSVFIGSNDSLSFSGQPANSPNSVLLAGIFQYPNIGNYQCIITNQGSNSAWGIDLFGIDNTNTTIARVGGNNYSSGMPTLSANTPYFAAVCYNTGQFSGPLNFVVTNLATGKIFTGVTTAGLGQNVSSDGTYLIGQYTGGGAGTNGYIAAAMYAETFLSIAELVEWAKDPWSFWYPQSLDLAGILQSAVPVAAVVPSPGLLQTRSRPGLGPASRHVALLNSAAPITVAPPTVTGGTLPFMGVG